MEQEIFGKALALAARYHMGQTRKDGVTPYIYHPIGVAALVRDAGYDLKVQTVAILHDVLEDTDCNESEIRAFGEDIFEAVSLLTRPDGAREAEYVARILENPIAAAVKNADKIYNLWNAVYGGTTGEKRSKSMKSFTDNYIRKSEKYYKGKFSKALDMSIEMARTENEKEFIGELQHPCYTRDEMRIFKNN